MARARALLRYSATRLGLAPVMLWLIATLVFLLLRVAPGDPVDAVLGSRAPAAAKAAMRARLGLDQSLLDQYIHYLHGLIQGDLGQGLINQEPVSNIINRTLPASLELSVVALVVAAIVGLSIGFSGIARPEGKLDLAGRLYGLGTYALPPFWVAMLVQLLFAVSLGWLPVGGRFPPSLMPPQGSGFYLIDSMVDLDWTALRGTIRHLVLPAGTLALLLSGTFTTALRLNLRRTLRGDYVEAARSRGLSETQVVLRHGLPNALLPVLTIAGITVASLIGGALLIEVTFSWPGIALRLQEAINQRDYPVVQGIVVVIAAMVVLVSVAVDLLVAALDPRIRY
ncbi:oligopeptide ABC transporter, membrane component [Synechococcus sp. WH 8103]|jgi:peptide/nickel transport system permease protein|uniref:ABC transporter, oligopeptides n=1 Tax=Parasynechococcus marenigrum (strain WH8102) TaxID=84588 RepID=Q7U8B3_PARMW|nr:ABC transporter permease [Parasynechococcus marenigrum]CAE07223.1 putative ABC transporter, oligopeptides [Parasynechococcus marenigrum WH 8102]CRY91550.1 oligopeptide ABC transporter, membrane component [Synechococcus sp. WH 8103]